MCDVCRYGVTYTPCLFGRPVPINAAANSYSPVACPERNIKSGSTSICRTSSRPPFRYDVVRRSISSVDNGASSSSPLLLLILILLPAVASADLRRRRRRRIDSVGKSGSDKPSSCDTPADAAVFCCCSPSRSMSIMPSDAVGACGSALGRAGFCCERFLLLIDRPFLPRPPPFAFAFTTHTLLLVHCLPLVAD